MDKDVIKNTNKMLEDGLLIKRCSDSYISKKQLIDLLSNLDFKDVKSLELSVITGYLVRDENGKQVIDTLGFVLRLY